MTRARRRLGLAIVLSAVLGLVACSGSAPPGTSPSRPPDSASDAPAAS